MNLRTLLSTFVITVFAGCAGGPESTVVQPYNTRGGGGTGGAGGVFNPNPVPVTPPDICSVPEPGPINLDTSWDGKTDLWAGHRGVIIVVEDQLNQLGYLGIDPVANVLVWYGVSMSYRLGELNAMAGTCHFPPPPTGHRVGDQAPVGRLPGTPPPSSGGGEKHNWTGQDCDDLRIWAANAAWDIANGRCTY